MGMNRSQLAMWREERGMTQRQVADAAGVTVIAIREVERGEVGLVGELQDYLTDQGENVSDFARHQSAFIANRHSMG